MQLHLRTQTELLADIRARVRESSAARWTDVEIYRAIGDAIMAWSSRVSIPVYYDFGTLTAGTYAYALPDYIDEDAMFIQWQKTIEGGDGTNTNTWIDAAAWDVEVTAAGIRQVRFSAPVYAVNARILYWKRQGRIPTALPVTSAQIVAADTSVTLTTAADVDDAGYVKIDGEYLFYSGVARGASTIVLQNLLRGQWDSTAATHSGGASVAFCVSAPTVDLWAQLYDQTIANLHNLWLHTASPDERDRAEKMMVYHQGKADMFWRRYRPIRSSRLNLSRESVMA